MAGRKLIVAETAESYFVAAIPPAHPSRLAKEHIGFENWLYGWPLGQLAINTPDQQVFGFDKRDLQLSLAINLEGDTAKRKSTRITSLPFTEVLDRLAEIVEGQPIGEVVPIQDDDDLQKLIADQL